MKLLKLLLLLPVVLILITLCVGFYDPDCNVRVGHGIESLSPTDRATANYWYNRAAEKDNLEGLSFSGTYYLFGYGPQDKKKGIEYLSKAVKEKDKFAINCMALAYEWGIGVEQDFSKARDLQKELISIYEEKGGDSTRKSRARYRLCHIYTMAPPPVRNIKEARVLLRKLIELEEQDYNPYETLGLIYFYGADCEKDDAKAFKYLKQGAKLGGRHARECLGRLYLTGSAEKKNLVLANKWLKLSGNQGNLDAQFILAISRAIALPKLADDEDNSKWQNILESRGFKFMSYFADKSFASKEEAIARLTGDSVKDMNAATILGVMYHYGIGLVPDHARSKELLTRAQNAGVDDAKVIESISIFAFPGPIAELKRGRKLIGEASKNKHKTAILSEAIILSSGILGKQDWNKCYSNLSTTNLDNDPESAFLLAQCKIYGLGTERNALEGLSITNKLALGGYSDAAQYLIDNFDTFDKRDRIKFNKKEVLEACMPDQVAEQQYLLGGVLDDRKEKNNLYRLAYQNGYIKAKYAIHSESYEDNKKSQLSAIDDPEKTFETEATKVASFKKNFVRAKNSKQVVRVIHEFNKGDIFSRDSIEVAESDFILGTYLDGEDKTLEFLEGKVCLSNIAKGNEISIYDIGEVQED